MYLSKIIDILIFVAYVNLQKFIFDIFYSTAYLSRVLFITSLAVNQPRHAHYTAILQPSSAELPVAGGQ